MKELGIDLSGHYPQGVNVYLKEAFDDPAEATGTEDEIMGELRRIRDEIRDRIHPFYLSL